MADKGYTNVKLVASEIGLESLDAQQTEYCLRVIESVEDYIDRRTARSWAQTPVTSKRFAYHPTIQLGHPVSTVTSIVAKYMFNTTSRTLTAVTDYDVDLDRGVITFRHGYPNWDFDAPRYDYVLITYTPNNNSVPPTIRIAATKLVAYYMQNAMDHDRYGVFEYEVGEDIRVRFREYREGFPVEVTAMIDSYRKIVFA